MFIRMVLEALLFHSPSTAHRPRICRNTSCLFALLAAVFVSGVTVAQEPQADEATAQNSETTPAIPDLNSLVMQLAGRDTYKPATEALITIGGNDVEAIFAHIKNRKLYLWQDRIVYIPAFGKTNAGVSMGKAYAMTTPAPGRGQSMAGQVIGEVSKPDARMLKVQRKARKQITKAMMVIGLHNKDVTKRRVAAKKVGDTRQGAALVRLGQMAETDKDAKTRFLAKESAALIILSGNAPDADEAERLAAAKELGQLKSIRAFHMLKDLYEAEGVSDTDAAVYDTAITLIERHKTVSQWTSHTFRGFSLGTILVLIALGLAITFGLMGVINMAHGEMLMIGAIATWATFSFFSGTLFSSENWAGKFAISLRPPDTWFDWYYVVALPIAFLVSAFAGWLTEVLVVRWLYKRPLDSLLATIGVSLIMIQGIRLWKGDNLGMRHPSWATGGWEVMQDVVLPYNRLFLITLASSCLLSIVLLFRYTRIGLLIRATVQNREIAQSLGVNTRLIDMFTFSFGAGLAGLAGYGLFLTSNPTPEMGQTYIVQAFQTVVVGGVGKLIGVMVSGLGIGFLQKFIEPLPLMDPGWATVVVLLIVIGFIQRRPAGLFPDKGRLANQTDGNSMPWLATSSSTNRRDLILAILFVGAGLIVIPGLYLTGMILPSTLNKFGQYLAFSMIAIGLDLVWGYVGILSLCQCLFFALGGYCMGFYLINHGPMDEFGIPACLAYVMSDVADKRPPGYLSLFHNFPISVFLSVLVTGGISFIIGATCFRSRVRGVYFSILTQAILVAFWNVWVKNDMRMGGTNGLTFDPTKTMLMGATIANKPFPNPEDFNSGGYLAQYISVAIGQTRFWLYITSFLVLATSFFLARMLVRSRFGRVMVAIRDDETRLRFIGYQTWVYKAVAFAIAGGLAGIGGMLYVPQKGIITPKFMEPFWSIMVVVWVALGGRGTLWGAVLGTIGVSMLYDTMTSIAPEYWKLVLGGLFILVPIALPGGIMSLPAVAKKLFHRPSRSDGTDTEPPTIATVGGHV